MSEVREDGGSVRSPTVSHHDSDPGPEDSGGECTCRRVSFRVGTDSDCVVDLPHTDRQKTNSMSELDLANSDGRDGSPDIEALKRKPLSRQR